MTTVHIIAKNTGVLFLASIISYVLGFFYIMYISRYLGVEGFGILSFALALTGIFGIFNDMGLKSLAVREIAKEKALAEKYLGNILTMKFFMCLITLGLIATTIHLLGYPSKTIKVIYILAFSVAVNSFSELFYSIFQAYERMKYQSLGQILNSCLMLIGILFGISTNFNVVGFAFIYLIVNLIVLVYAFGISSWEFFSPKIEIDLTFWKVTIKEAIPFGITGVTGLIYTYSDSVMLSVMKGDEVVGWYNAAYKLVLILLFIPQVINLTIFPSMCRFYIYDKNSLKSIYEQYFRIMLMVGIPLGIGTLLLAKRIILLIFGIEYMQSVIVLQILIWTIVFTFAGAPFVKLFECSNRQVIVTKISFVCVILNVLINLLLIPKFSYIGSSVATVITECFFVSLIIYYAYKTDNGININIILKLLIKILFADLMMGVFIMSFDNLNIFILILLAVLLHLGMVYILGGINKDDRELFKQLSAGVTK